MSTYIGLQSTIYEVGNRQWLLSEPQTKPDKTLDISKFNQTGSSEVQTISVTGSPTGGTFTLTYGGQTTAAIPYNASLAAVQAALQALPNIGSGFEGLSPLSGYQTYPGGVVVTGTPGTSYVVTFQGALANLNVPAITATPSLTGGTSPSVSVAQTTQGVTAHYPNGYIPSGCAVGIVTATGRVGPYDATASDGRQNIYGFTYADVRAVWFNGGQLVVADRVGTGIVNYDAAVSLSKLPFPSGSPGGIDAAGITALPTIRFES